MFSARVMEPKRAPDWKRTPKPMRSRRNSCLMFGIDLDPVDANLPGIRPVQADQVLQEGGLAAAAAAQDHQNLAFMDLKADAGEDGIVAEAGGEIFDFDDRGFIHQIYPSLGAEHLCENISQ